MFASPDKKLVAIQAGEKPEMRIMYNEGLETFYLQKKHLFVWREEAYTFDPKTVRTWRGAHHMIWVNKRWSR